MSKHVPPSKPRGPDEKPAPPLAPALRVRATRPGYYDEKRRRLGDVFSIQHDGEFSAKWMERVPEDTPERLTTGQDELEQRRQEHLRAQRGGAATPPGPVTGDRDVLGGHE